MKKIVFSIIAVVSLAGLFAFAAAQSWQITDKYSIKFSGGSIGGIFKKFSGSIAFDEQNLATSKFDVSIDVASLNTGNGLQNKHAKGAEWFDSDKYPAIKFVSKKIAKAGSGYQATGDLQVKDVTKEVTIPFTFQKAGNAGTFTGSLSINRGDYHVGKPGGDVADVIKIDISVPVTKK